MLDLVTGDHSAFVSGPRPQKPDVLADPEVHLPPSYQGGFFAWRRGETTINAASHTASPAYVRELLRCAEYEAAERTAQGTVWRLPHNGTRVVVERRGVLIGAVRADPALVLQVSDALGAPTGVGLPAAWQALEEAAGPAAALVRERRACERFRVLDVISNRRAELRVRLPAGERLRLRDVREPPGIDLHRLRQSGTTATARVTVDAVRIRRAEKAALLFAGVQGYLLRGLLGDHVPVLTWVSAGRS